MGRELSSRMLTSYDALPYSNSSESGHQNSLHWSIKTIRLLLPQETSENVRKAGGDAGPNFKYLWTGLCFETAAGQTSSLDSHRFREHAVNVIT